MGWYEKAGGHETGDIEAIDGSKRENDFRNRQGNPFYNEKGMMDFDPVNQRNKETVNSYLTGLGMDPGKMSITDENFRTLYQYADRQNQGDIADLYTPFEADVYEFHRWAVTDWAIGLWNRGVAGMAGAIMSMPATVGAALTGSASPSVDRFWDSWERGVEDMEKAISFTPSDKALIPITDEMNWHNMGFAIGDGLGFVGDIFLGSKGMGMLAKASKGAKGVQKMQRLGSFLTGTAQMQKDLYRESRKMGLSVGESARVSLPIASIVALTEGAALEMIGKTISNPLSRSLGRQALKAELKALGKNKGKLTAAQFQKLTTDTTKSFGLKLKGMGQKAYQGAAIEGVQEFTQTYIEEFGKQVFDMYFADEKAAPKQGMFGADVTSYKAFQKAMMSAFVGAIVGGQVSGAGSMIRGSKGDTVFNYVNDAVVNNKPNRLAKLRKMVNNMSKENNPALVRKTIQDMIDFSQRTGGLNIESPTAKYQLFQLMQIEKQFQDKFNIDFGIDNKTHAQVANAYRHNQKKATWLNQAMQMEMQAIINDKKPATTDINKFEKKLDAYHDLFNKISKNKISEEQLKKEIEKLESPKVKEIREAVATMMAQKEQSGTSVAEEINKGTKKNTDLEFYEYAPGKKASKEALNDMEKLEEEFQKIDQTDKTALTLFGNKLLSKYGMEMNEFHDLKDSWTENEVGSRWKKKELKQVKTKSKEETKAVKETEKATKETEKVLEEEKASRVEELENQIKKQKEIVAKLGPEAKVGDNRGYEANLKLKELENELRIERIAENQANKSDSEVIGFKNKEDKKFYDDNRESIDKRIKEIRKEKSKPKPKKKTEEKVEEKKKEKTQDQKDRESIREKRNEIKKELDEVNQKIKSSRKKGKGRKALFNKRQELEEALDAIDKGRVDEISDNRPEISKEDSTKEELQDERKQIINDGDILQREIEKTDKELKEFKKQSRTKQILNRGKRKSLEAKRKKLVDAQNKLRDEIVEIDKAIEEKAKPKKKIPLTEEMVPDFVEDKEAVEEEIAETLEEKDTQTEKWVKGLVNKYEDIHPQIADQIIIGNITEEQIDNDIKNLGKEKAVAKFEKLLESVKQQQEELTKETENKKVEQPTKEDLTEEIVPESVDEKAVLEALNTETFTEDDELSESVFSEDEIKELNDLSKKEKNDKDTGPKDQRKSIRNNQEQQKNRAKAKNNPELFQKVLEHVQRLFPNIPVHVLRDAIWNLPISTVSQINNLGMMINADQAFQNSALHEAGHMFVKILGRDNPIVKAGMEYIKGTEYFNEAQRLYPELSIEDQAEEALMNAIADNSLEKIKTKLDGTNAQKFVAWLKKFWNTIKKNLRIVKGKQAVDMFGDILAYSKSNYEVNLGFLENFTKDQRSYQHDKTLETIQNSFTRAQMEFLLGNNNLDPSKNAIAKAVIYQGLSNLLEDERSGVPKSNQVFDGLSSESVASIMAEKNSLKAGLKLAYALREQSPTLFVTIETAANQLAKIKIQPLEDIENLTKVSMKGDQSVSKSVRTILTTIIDDDGFLQDNKKVYKEIAKIADRSIDNKSYEENLREEAITNPIAKRLNAMLNELSPEVKEGVVSELASITNIEYRSMLKRKISDDSGRIVNRVLWQTQNRDNTVKELLDDYQSNLRRLDYNKLNYMIDNINKMSIKEDHFDYMQKNEWFYATKDLMEQLTGHTIADKEWMNYLIELESRPKATENTIRWAVGSSKFGIGQQIKEAYNGNDFDFKAVNKYFRTLAESKSGDAIASNFVNLSGNNVSAARLGYWVNQFNKMFTLDQNFQKEFLKSQIYKDNPFLKKWAKENKLPKWFIHDAFENIGQGKPIEHSKAEESDIILTNLMYYTQNPVTSDVYSQSIGVTGDRGHLTYVEAPKYNDKQLAEVYSKRAELDKVLLNRKLAKAKTNAEKNKIISQYNNLSLMKAKLTDGKLEVIEPMKNPEVINKIKKDVKYLKKLLEDTGTKEAVLHENKINEESLDSLLERYILTERVNRSYLEDIYAGPAIDRKSVADVMKRMGGLNSGGKIIQLDKPVHVFVINTKGLSDSFSFNSANLQARISQMSGPTDEVGVNVKDMLYQVDKDGNMDYFKMTSLGVVGETDKHSLSEFVNKADDQSTVDYQKIGNAIIAIEKALGEGAYVKIIDQDVIKGDKDAYSKAIDIDEFVKRPLDFVKQHKLKDFNNYRVAFNLYKDFTKVPLTEQTVTLSTQYSKILLNYGVTQDQIQEFENTLVNVLNDALYTRNSKGETVIQGIKNVETLLNNITKNSEENAQSSIMELLSEMKKLNSGEKVNVYEIGSYTYTETQLQNLDSLILFKEKVGKTKTQEEFVEALTKLKLTEDQFNNLITEDANNKFNNDLLTPKEKKVSEKSKNPLKSFDHPNLRPMVEQFIASKLTKAGVRVEASGIYSHMMPDYSNNLKGYMENDNQPMEIAVPWSMFVQQRENESPLQAKQRAEKMLEENPELFRTVVVRVPASGSVSGFAGQVKFFTEGKSNTSIMPKQFVEKSDADHDGDKVFIYRADINENGETIDSNKTKAFNQMYELASSPSVVQAANEGNLDLKEIENLLRSMTDKDGNSLFNENIFKLNDFRDFAKLANNMSFGQDAIGIWAVASKMLSVLSQSQEELKTPIEFSFVNNELGNVQRKKFSNKSLDDVARFLQAALDMGNDPIHISTGINQHTIGVATVLAVLGVESNEMIGFLKHPAITNLVDQIQEEKSNYKDKGYVDVAKYVESVKQSYDAPISNLTSKSLNYILNNNGTKVFRDTIPGEGVFKTKDGKEYFKQTIINEIETTRGPEYVVQFNKIPKFKGETQAELEIISKFQELTEISENLLKLIPVLQLDNKLPNNGYAANELSKTMSDLKADKMLFTTKNLVNRPLIKHYDKLIQNQKNIYSQYFFIENQEFFNLADNITEAIYGKSNAAFKKKAVYDAMVESFYRNQAQKEILNNVDVPQIFIEEFTNEVSILLDSVSSIKSGGKVKPLVPSNLDSATASAIYNQLSEASQYGIEAFNVTKKQIAGRNNDNPAIIQYLNNFDKVIDLRNRLKEVNPKTGKSLSENRFLEVIKIDKNKNGEITINPIRTMNNASQGALKIVQQEFNELPIDLQEKFKNYAMMRFGIANKINSLAGLMPIGIQMAVLKRNNQLKNYGINDFFHAGSYKNRIDTVKTNTAIMLKNQLPKVSLMEDKGKMEFGDYKLTKTPHEIIAIHNSEFLNVNGRVFRKTPTPTTELLYTDVSTYGAFISDNYTRLINDYSNINRKPGDIDNKAKEVINNC